MARANRIREIWAGGKAVINSWCGIPSSFSAEVMAHKGWDSLVVDMQHGMIETVEAMENLDDILSVKGLDAVYIGPSDLSISMGYAPGGDKPDQWMMDALKKVVDSCRRHKVQPGLHCGAASYAKKAIEMGFTFVTVGGDNRFLTMGAQAAVAEMKDAPEPGGSSSPY